jgi:flavin-dependent dehydrogenase
MSDDRTGALDPSYDAVVIGARCAGAAVAMLLARKGLKVLVADRSAYGSDTLSTLALMRGGVMQLHRWGVLEHVRRADTPPVRSAVFHYGDVELAVPIKARDGVDALYAPRRTILDSLLADEAVRSGATVVHGVRLLDLARSADGRVRGVLLEDRARRLVTIGAGIVIGADGLHSTVARLVSALTYRSGRQAAEVVYGFWGGLDLQEYHWYYRPGASAGAIPTNGGLTCVFAAAPPGRLLRGEGPVDLKAGYHRVLREAAPEVEAAIGRARQADRLRGFAGQPGFLRQSWGPGWALVGDAGYFKDPLTAHGITDALRDAELLARAVVEGGEAALADYQAARDDLSVGMLQAADDIASFEWDLTSVMERHHFISDEMTREVAMLRDLDRSADAVAG